MPSVRLIRIPQNESVNSALHSGVVDLLPAQIAENELVKWVVAFDDVTKKIQDKEDESRLFSQDDELWMAAFLGRMASGFLQARIPFYFASVFHIGRMMVVAEESLKRIETLQLPSSLDSSVGNIESNIASRTSSPLGDLSQASIRDVLINGCERASSLQKKQLELADRWWMRWQSEVRELRAAVSGVEEGWRACSNSKEFRRISKGVLRLWQTTTTGTLKADMERSGVRFTNLNVPAGGIESSLAAFNPLLLLAFTGRQDPEFWHFELRHVFYDMRMHQYVAHSVQQLSAKYQNTDPFAVYEPGRSPADKQLVALIQENLLWNNEESPWLHAWDRKLVQKPYETDWVGRANFSSDAGIDWLDYADSAIKKALINQRPLPGESLNQFIQDRFEEHVVAKIAVDVREWMRSGKSAGRQYTAEELFAVFVDVVQKLNEIGYKLNVPPLSFVRTNLGISG
jgi:hypothetical protein